MIEQLHVLGTGHATVKTCYNTCFALQQGDEFLLVDAGGGNGILPIFDRMNIPPSKIRHAFLSHKHTDHMLGMVWVVRLIGTMMNSGLYDGSFTIFVHDGLAADFEWLLRLSLDGRVAALVGNRLIVQAVHDGECVEAGPYLLECFDIHSTKARQFGFSTHLSTGQKLCFLGDEPFREECLPYAQNSAWLLSEAFCLYAERDIFHPYEKYHSTVRDAAALATRLGVDNLVLWHSEDSHGRDRRALYVQEARSVYSGHVFVPNDGDLIELHRDEDEKPLSKEEE